MFLLLVAGELYGRKHNIEVGFPARPKLEEVAGHCETTFASEARRLRPKNTPLHKFVIDNIKIFDDTLNRWVDLSSPLQLVEWSQLYLFQLEGRESDAQAILDAPVRLRSPIIEGNNKERFFFLFHDMDFNGNGHLSRDEVQRVFNVFCLYQYGEKDVDRMFYQFDTAKDNVLSYAEFTKWMTAMPRVGEDLLKKSIEYWEAWTRRPNIRDSSEMTARERDAILHYLARSQEALEANRRNEEEMRRAQERLLREHEEELLRLKEHYTQQPPRQASLGGASPKPMSPPGPSRGGSQPKKGRART